MNALSAQGVKMIPGKFIPVKLTFKKDSMPIIDMGPYILENSCIPDMIKYQTHAEKRTDVNIAATIIDYAYQDIYDHAFIITGDNDIAPAIEIVKKRFPLKKFTLVLPMNKQPPGDLIDICDGPAILLDESYLAAAQLPNPVMSGSEEIYCPISWK